MKHLVDRSGRITSDDKLVLLLYRLLRDHVLPADLEEIVMDIERDNNKHYTFSNGWLAQYAEDILKRIRNEEK